MNTKISTTSTSNQPLIFNCEKTIVGTYGSFQKGQCDQTVTKQQAIKCKYSHRPMAQRSGLMQAIFLVFVICCTTLYAEAGGKGEKGSEGNIIISTGGGGGHTEKIKIMKIPVPFPVIKHVPYPVPVPIIQKKYIPVEKYIPVYKHHHGSSHEGAYGSEESQQHDQYGSSAGASNTDQENMNSNQATSGSSYENSPYSSSYKSSARMSGGHYWQPQMFSPQQPMSADGPYSLQMASSNGPDMNNIFSGSSGYQMGYNTGHPDFGRLYSSLSSGAGYGYGQASNPSYQTAYGFGSNLYGSGGGDSNYQQYGSSSQSDYPAAYPSLAGYGSLHDSESSLYQQSLGMGLTQGTHMNVPSSSSSLSSSSSSPGSSVPIPRYASKSSSPTTTQNSQSLKLSALSTSTSSVPSSSSQTSSTRSNRAYTIPQSSNTSPAKYSKSSSLGSSSTSAKLNGLKPTSGSGKLIAGSLSVSPSSAQTSNEMVAVSSTPQAYHQSLLAPSKNPSNEQKLDTLNSRPKSSVVQLPNAQPSMVSVIPQQLSHQQQQQQQVGQRILPQQAPQHQSTFSSSLLSPTQVGDQILQRFRKFTNHLTNTTQTLQQQVGIPTLKL